MAQRETVVLGRVATATLAAAALLLFEAGCPRGDGNDEGDDFAPFIGELATEFSARVNVRVSLDSDGTTLAVTLIDTGLARGPDYVREIMTRDVARFVVRRYRGIEAIDSLVILYTENDRSGCVTTGVTRTDRTFHNDELLSMRQAELPAASPTSDPTPPIAPSVEGSAPLPDASVPPTDSTAPLDAAPSH